MERSGRGWAIWSLCGIAAWVGVTVLASVLNDDPSDAAPVTRTFAIAGGVFFGVTFGAAALQMRRLGSTRHADLYRQLALRPVSDAEVRSATRGMASIAWTYLVFGAAVTFLMLLAIGLHDEDLFPILLWLTVGLVGVWLLYMVVALRQAYSASTALFEPLGLHAVGTDVVGERHGRQVTIRFGPEQVSTHVAGSFDRRATLAAQQLALLTGQPWTAFRRASASRGAEGVVVQRAGRDASRWLLVDLQAAEALADG
jgi:hypothetical protein